MKQWKIRGGTLMIGERTLVMGILNVTPDSFSDGGRFSTIEPAVERAAVMIAEGADIIDVGGESTRPGAMPITEAEEVARVVPVVEALGNSLAVPLSVDTTKASVAHQALAAGARIINDISGLRFEPRLADEAAHAGAGIILMHSLGERATLHTESPVANILSHVADDWRRGIAEAIRRGVAPSQIALDPGFGFGKTHEQNVELLANLGVLANEFSEFPILVGTSRKRFIGRLLGNAPVESRLYGTTATVAAAALAGASVVRVHDVQAAIETVRVADALRQARLGGKV